MGWEVVVDCGRTKEFRNVTSLWYERLSVSGGDSIGSTREESGADSSTERSALRIKGDDEDVDREMNERDEGGGREGRKEGLESVRVRKMLYIRRCRRVQVQVQMHEHEHEMSTKSGCSDSRFMFAAVPLCPVPCALPCALC